MSESSDFVAASGPELHARELYAFERLADPSLPAWDDATYMTHSRFLRAAMEAPIGRAA